VTPPSSTAKPGPELKDGKPVFGSKAATATEAPSLFDCHEPTETPAESQQIPTPSNESQPMDPAAETIPAVEQMNV
jgi:hypothetical protein